MHNNLNLKNFKYPPSRVYISENRNKPNKKNSVTFKNFPRYFTPYINYSTHIYITLYLETNAHDPWP